MGGRHKKKGCGNGERVATKNAHWHTESIKGKETTQNGQGGHVSRHAVKWGSFEYRSEKRWMTNVQRLV
jgi:hypothetical protein